MIFSFILNILNDLLCVCLGCMLMDTYLCIMVPASNTNCGPNILCFNIIKRFSVPLRLVG